MELLDSYKQQDVAKELGITRLSIWKGKNKDKYIPIKFEDAFTRRTKRGYGVRYIKISDVEKYLKNNKNKK